MISPDLALWLSGVLAGLGLALLPAALRSLNSQLSTLNSRARPRAPRS